MTHVPSRCAARVAHVPPRPVEGPPAGPKESVPPSRQQAAVTAVTAEVTAHKVKRARAGRRRPAREDRERARRAAEEAGPQGRPENANPLT